MSAYIECDGKCGKRWPTGKVNHADGPAISIQRLDSTCGGNMPSPAVDWHFCYQCGPKVGQAVEAIANGHEAA